MATFLRYEKKFLVNKEQHDELLRELDGKIAFDKHTKNGKYNVYTIYFDDKDNNCIRHSVSKPIFKEKMRIRSYRYCTANDDVYLEVKKKYDGYGSKRRIKVSYMQALNFINYGVKPTIVTNDEKEDYLNKQIVEEMSAYLVNKKLKPFVFMQVDREAYYFIDNEETRITFDSNVKYRYDNFEFCEKPYSGSLLNDDEYICEIKFEGAISYELAQILSKLEIYRTKYSKVGKIYEQDNEEIIKNVLSNTIKTNNKNKR